MELSSEPTPRDPFRAASVFDPQSVIHAFRKQLLLRSCVHVTCHGGCCGFLGSAVVS